MFSIWKKDFLLNHGCKEFIFTKTVQQDVLHFTVVIPKYKLKRDKKLRIKFKLAITIIVCLWYVQQQKYSNETM